MAGGVLGEVRAALRAIVDALDTEALTVAEARSIVREFAAIERLAAAGKLFALRRSSGDAAWLARESGVSFGQARGVLAAADALGDVPPNVASAVRSGSLSEAQTREIAPAAAADPSAADELLTAAKDEAFGKLKQRCAKVLHAAGDDDERAKRVHAGRSLRIWQDAEGAGRIEIKGPSPVIARFRAALAPHREAAFREARRAGRRQSADAIAFDGLVRWLEASAGDGPTRKRRRRNPDAEVIVLVDAEALRRGSTERGETCEIAGLGPVSVSTAREVLGDGLLSIVVKEGVDVRTVVHTKRTINEIVHTALLAQDWKCSTETCPNVHHLERDHVEAICLGGWTALSQLDLKCRTCHRDKTRDDLRRLRERRGQGEAA
jgi:hypothetical protein